MAVKSSVEMRQVSGRISDETELIQTYLAPLAAPGAFSLNDDAALIEFEAGYDLVVSTDPVVAGVHFFPDDDPRDIAWKALAVNVSDLVAKGAQPAAYTMALALPEAPLRSWMAEFSAGLEEAQKAFGCTLIGGDTDRTSGQLSIGISAFGKVPRKSFIQRSTARMGDHVFVTGPIGDAALGLKLRRDGNAFPAVLSDDQRQMLLRRYHRPEPPLNAIGLLRAYATAALDVSDGLVQDATRLARGANAALSVAVTAVPFSDAVKAVLAASLDATTTLLTGGDDYQVLFSVDAQHIANMQAAAAANAQPIYELGVLTAGAGVTFVDEKGAHMAFNAGGYDHFRRL
jgi:thiamine-monophosphate kinase